MLLVRALKFIAGYVVFSARGGFGERFINLCALGRVRVWDMTCFDGCIKGKIAVRDFHKLRRIVRKTGVRLKIIEKVGLPFYFQTHRHRMGLVISAVFYIVFCMVMNRFVWCIDTSDGNKFSREQIVSAARNAGLHQGIYVPGFDEEKAAREIFKSFNGELSWVKVNIKGSLAAIDYREKNDKLQIEEKGEPSNIVADFDGVIVSDETYQGAKNISRGSAVKRGDVLISGIVEGIDQKPLYYEAKGKFTALHNDVSELTLSGESPFYCFADIREFYTLEFFGLKIPLGAVGYTAEERALFTVDFFAEYDGHVLPFSISKTTVASYEKRSLPMEELSSVAVLNYSDYTYNKYGNSNIVSSQVTRKIKNNSVIITGEYQCVDFIGESKPIIIDNS